MELSLNNAGSQGAAATSATPLVASAPPVVPGAAAADALGGCRCAGRAFSCSRRFAGFAAAAAHLPLPHNQPLCSIAALPLPAPDSGQKATPAAATGALPIAWLATAPVPPAPDGVIADGVIATVNDRRLRLGPASAPEDQQPSLYRLCRQWVQNDPDLPPPLADVRQGALVL